MMLRLPTPHAISLNLSWGHWKGRRAGGGYGVWRSSTRCCNASPVKQQVRKPGNNGSVAAAAATDQLENNPIEQRRWFSPQVTTTSPKDAPFMFYLPGMDSSGSGMHRQHESLARLFEVCSFQMPTTDRTPFPELLEIVESAVLEEAQRRPSSPIYIVGEGLGGALALGIAARNPTLDLLLILVNPATSFAESQLQSVLLPLLSNLPFELPLINVPSSLLNFAFGSSFEAPQATVPLSGDGVELSKDTLLWKLKMMQQAAAYANSRLHAVKAEVLVLASDKDQVLPSSKEADKLKKLIKGCRTRKIPQVGHKLLQEPDFDLATVIKSAGCYRHSKKWDPVTDFSMLTDQEVAKFYDSNVRMIHQLASPVFFSTSPEGQIIQGLANVPTDRPIMLVGYHMFLGMEIGVVVNEVFKEKNILLRGLAHPGVVGLEYEGEHQPDPANGDLLRLFGSVPSYGRSMYKLLQQGNSALLYPGGTREALHRKGEAYKLFWPERSEFVQMAVRHGVTIIPFGGIGEDDFVDIVLDLHDLRKFPALLDMVTPKNMPILRQELGGELADQAIHLPIAVPKGIGRFYFLMQKPIVTAGREEEFRDRAKVQELYLHVKSEVESAMHYLQKKREVDPYRYFLQRALYESPLGHNKQAPTFKP